MPRSPRLQEPPYSFPQSAGPPDEEGWVRVTIPVESFDQAAIDLLLLGTEAEVLKPRDLRRRVAAAAKAMASLNA